MDGLVLATRVACLVHDEPRAVVRGVDNRLVEPVCARTVAWAGAATWATPKETKPAVATAASFRICDVFTRVRARASVPCRPEHISLLR